MFGDDSCDVVTVSLAPFPLFFLVLLLLFVLAFFLGVFLVFLLFLALLLRAFFFCIFCFFCLFCDATVSDDLRLSWPQEQAPVIVLATPLIP